MLSGAQKPHCHRTLYRRDTETIEKFAILSTAKLGNIMNRPQVGNKTSAKKLGSVLKLPLNTVFGIYR